MSMTAIHVVTDGTQTESGPVFDPRKAIRITQMITVIGMPRGMKSGDPSVMLRIPTPGVSDLFVETSLRVFCQAADGLKEYYKIHHGFKYE